MTVEYFCVLLLAFGTIATVITEFIKTYADGQGKTYNTQLIAVIVGGIVGIVGTFVVYVVNGTPITVLNALWAIFEGVATIIGSQIGYDKIVSVIKSALGKV